MIASYYLKLDIRVTLLGHSKAGNLIKKWREIQPGENSLIYGSLMRRRSGALPPVSPVSVWPGWLALTLWM